MQNVSPQVTRRFIVAAAVALSCAFLNSARATAQQWGVHQTVARISYLSGDVSYSRGDDPDDWQAPVRNVPFTLGDRIYSSDSGRVELQIHGGEFVRLAPRTDLAALNLTDDVKQFSLSSGSASFQLRRLDDNETFEVDTPNVAVTFERPGDYRIDVDASGNSRVSCLQGEASVAAGGGEVPLRQGNQMWIDGVDNPQYDVAPLDQPDSWDHWVQTRESRYARASGYRYVNFNIGGMDDLDEYGRWVDIPAYGQCWTPSTVEFGWQPYQTGRWIWQDPWGWTWIGDEPWGWAPYHYGRWVVYSSRWYWVPAGPAVAVEYSPALVAFVGGGPGWSLSFSSGGGGYVGWFPLAPRDPFVPWWGERAQVNVNVTNVTYVNRTYVTVVNQNTFVSGGAVAANAVRDPQVVRQIAAAAVIRGPVPVVPTTGALRVSVRSAVAVGRPPAAVVARAVVTRVPPPPAPALFQAKLNMIRENRGAPVTTAAAAQLSIAARQGARAVAPVRPVVAESGRVTFQPRNAQSTVARPSAVTEHRGKPVATMDRPLIASPTAASTPSAEPPARIAPGAVVPPRNAPIAPREGAAPQTFERPVPPGQQPAAPPGQNKPEEDWRTRQRREPGRAEPTPPEQATPPPGQGTPPPDQGTAPPGPPPRRFERTPPAPPDQASPPPKGENRRVDQPAAPPPAGARPSAPVDRGQANKPKDRGKKPDQGKPKEKKEKEKKNEPPPPSA